MRLSIFFLWLLEFLSRLGMAVQASCSAPIKARVIGQLSRNATGHWLANATLQQTSYAAEASALRMELVPSIERCKGVSTHAITITLTGNPLPPGPGYKATACTGSYYKVHGEDMDWEEAKTICEEENAHLLILNSREEADEIKEMLKDYPNAKFVHLGITDKVKEGEWLTIFGQPISETGFNEWDEKEPTKLKTQNCGHLLISTMLMHDWNCTDKKHPFVCEQSL